MASFEKQVARAWHAEPAGGVLAAWNTTEHGLSQAEVVRRQQTYARNVLLRKLLGDTLRGTLHDTHIPLFLAQ